MYTSHTMEELLNEAKLNDGLVVFDHGIRTPEELAAEVMQLAFRHGWNDAEAAELLEVYFDPDLALPGVWSTYDTVDEAMSDAAWEASGSAEEYLNDYLQQFHDADGWAFYNDGEAGAFLLGPIDEG